jgi:hypothetical protein
MQTCTLALLKFGDGLWSCTYPFTKIYTHTSTNIHIHIYIHHAGFSPVLEKLHDILTHPHTYTQASAEFSRVRAALVLCANKTSLFSAGNRDFGAELTFELCNRASLTMPEFGTPGFSVSMRNQLRLYITILNFEIDIADFAFFLAFANAKFEQEGEGSAGARRFFDRELLIQNSEFERGESAGAHDMALHDSSDPATFLRQGSSRATRKSHKQKRSRHHTHRNGMHIPAGTPDDESASLTPTRGSTRAFSAQSSPTASANMYGSTCVRDPRNCCERFAQCDTCSGAPGDWHASLPACPCTYEQACPSVTRCRCVEGVTDLDCMARNSECVTQNVCAGGWRQADYLLVTWGKARHGAHKCVEKSQDAHAQRCCFDADGRLITRGPGAGMYVCMCVCMYVCVYVCVCQVYLMCM